MSVADVCDVQSLSLARMQLSSTVNYSVVRVCIYLYNAIVFVVHRCVEIDVLLIILVVFLFGLVVIVVTVIVVCVLYIRRHLQGNQQRSVGFGGGSDCANMRSGVATTVVGGWKVSLALFISQFFSPAASDAATHLDRVSINYLLSK